MGILLYTVHVITSLFLVLVVLLQQGKGADLSVFGGGATMTAFGARGAASLLHRLTVGGFVIFIVTTISIGIFQSRAGGSVMSDAPVATETPAAAATPPPAEAAPAGGEETAAPSEGVLPEAGGMLPEAAPATPATEETDEGGAAAEPDADAGDGDG